MVSIVNRRISQRNSPQNDARKLPIKMQAKANGKVLSLNESIQTFIPKLGVAEVMARSAWVLCYKISLRISSDNGFTEEP